MEHASGNVSSLRWRLIRVNYAAGALPADLRNHAVFNEHWNGALTARQLFHARAGSGVEFDVVFDELDASPFKPLAHLLRVRAARGTVNLKFSHALESPQFRG